MCSDWILDRTSHLLGISSSHSPSSQWIYTSATLQFHPSNFPCPPQTLALVKKSRLCCFFHHSLKLFVATTENSSPFLAYHTLFHCLAFAYDLFSTQRILFVTSSSTRQNSLPAINTKLKCHLWEHDAIGCYLLVSCDILSSAITSVSYSVMCISCLFCGLDWAL